MVSNLDITCNIYNDHYIGEMAKDHRGKDTRSRARTQEIKEDTQSNAIFDKTRVIFPPNCYLMTSLVMTPEPNSRKEKPWDVV